MSSVILFCSTQSSCWMFSLFCTMSSRAFTSTGFEKWLYFAILHFWAFLQSFVEVFLTLAEKKINCTCTYLFFFVVVFQDIWPLQKREIFFLPSMLAFLLEVTKNTAVSQYYSTCFCRYFWISHGLTKAPFQIPKENRYRQFPKRKGHLWLLFSGLGDMRFWCASFLVILNFDTICSSFPVYVTPCRYIWTSL